jgi:hypothetical protein
MGTGAEIAFYALAVAGTGTAIVQQHRAAQAQRKADKAGQAQAEIANQRSIRQAIAQSRIQQAQVLASGQAQTGGTDSSGIQGGLASAQSQLGANVGFARTTAAANNSINQSTQKYNDFMANAGTAQAIGNLGTQFGFSPESLVKKWTENKNQGPASGAP